MARHHGMDVSLMWQTYMFARYVQGQEEHGGYLPYRPGVLYELKEELCDAAVYFATLEEQLHRVLDCLNRWLDEEFDREQVLAATEALKILKAILGVKDEQHYT